jgi:hypothetical protein
MGLMDFLGKASGASGYGSAFGRSVFDNGLALGKTLYIGHGTDKSASPAAARLFENAEAMRSAGFELYCPDLEKWRPVDTSGALTIHCCAAGMAIASHLGMFCSRYFSRESNKSDFNRAMGAGTGDKLRQSGDGITVELFQSYMNITIPAGLKFVNSDAPGEGDLVGFYLNEVVKRCATYPIGFQRSGPLGFGPPAVALMDDTIKGFEDALAQFHW